MSARRIEEMYQICLGICVILSLFVGGFANNVYQKGQTVTVNCDPKQSGAITFWFQINTSGAKYLFTVKGKDEKARADDLKYTVNKNGDKVSLTIQSFEKKTDSGTYTCAAMNSNKLFFGELTEVRGEPDPTTAPKTAVTPPKNTPLLTTTKAQCNCPNKGPKPSINCEIWILSSLASGCVVLLILLIFTILYCNRLRTRRCPHHYKRQQRPAGHAKLPNNHL